MTLPVTERDALQLMTHAPGVAPPAPGSRLSTQGNVGLNSSGAREAANNFLLDGVDNNDLFLNRLVVNPSLDAIEEVSLLQNTYDAEFGRSAGAQVNVVLKSGTRDLRGTAYEFFRDSALDARNPLAAGRRSRKRRCASTSSAARSAGRSATLAVVLLRQRRGDSRAAKPKPAWRTCRPRPSAPATSARSGVAIDRSVHRRGPSPAT